MSGKTTRTVRNHESARTFFGRAERGVSGSGKGGAEERTSRSAQTRTEKRDGNLATLARRSIQSYEDIGGRGEYRSGARLNCRYQVLGPGYQRVENLRPET